MEFVSRADKRKSWRRKLKGDCFPVWLPLRKFITGFDEEAIGGRSRAAKVSAKYHIGMRTRLERS